MFFSTIRKTFGYLVILENIAVLVAVLMVHPPEVPATQAPDHMFGSLLLGWIGLSLVHALFASSGKPERITAVAALLVGGWFIYHTWMMAGDPSHDSETVVSLAEWQIWLILGAFLLPPVEQILDILLPPWPWSRD